MNKKRFSLALTLEALVLTAFSASGISFVGNENAVSDLSDGVFSLLVLPFELISNLLQLLSSKGDFFGGIAVMMLFLLGSLFFLPLAKQLKVKENLAENIILAITGAMFLFVTYSFCTENAFSDDSYGFVVKSVFSSTVWSGAVCFAVFKALKIFKTDNKGRLLILSKSFCFVVSFVLVFAFFGVSLSQFLTSLSLNVENEDKAVLFFNFLYQGVKCAFDVAVLFCFSCLADAMLKKADSDIINELSVKLTRLCIKALLVMVVMLFVKNTMQVTLFFALTNTHTTVSVPFTDVLFIGLVSLFSSLVRENKKLREDSELII